MTNAWASTTSLIKKEIVFVSDIYTPYDQVHHLYNNDTVDDWYKLNELTKHTRFPVIDDAGRVSGMITSKSPVQSNDFYE